MNKRSLSKSKTKEKILKAAKELFIKKGINKTSTINIAKKAGISHGALFVHYPSRNDLVVAVIYKEIRYITDKFYILLKEAKDLEALLNTYLEFVSKQEEFFIMIEKETPFLNKKVQEEIIMMECGVRSYFTEAIKDSIAHGEIKPVDMTTLISFLFGSVSYYLKNKQTLITKGSIIERKKDKIIQTFLTLIRQHDPKDYQNLNTKKEVILYG